LESVRNRKQETKGKKAGRTVGVWKKTRAIGRLKTEQKATCLPATGIAKRG